MTLAAGTSFGPYEILSPLGTGGMGEVYRARDARLGREVAVKVLPADLSGDAGRLKRFEREARAASALNHPGIVAIYEIGSADGTPYIAMELVAGKTLRELLLSGAMPVKKLLQVAAPLAEGLAAAHEAGIVHRDLKPENVMVTRDGVVKILDFGLAKLSAAIGGGEGSQPTVSRTEPGGLLGTVSYMSPEQASAQPVDFRSDQFSLGSILYELATGKRAFARDTGVDTLSAILHEEPKPMGSDRQDLPVPLVWAIERCLSKEPAGRYASTRDLARDLVTLRERSSEAGLSLSAVARRRMPRVEVLRRGLGVVALLAIGVLAGRLLWNIPPSPPTFRRMTFRRGLVTGARFTHDGQNVVYSARWGGEPEGLYLTRPDGKASLPLAFPAGSGLLAVSREGEAAITLRPSATDPHPVETLATAPLTGGAPRPLLDGVLAADWSPLTNELAVSRNDHLEYPLGKILYPDSVDMIRFSPRGDRIAFGWSGGNVVEDRVTPVVSVVDLAGKRTDIAHGQRNMNLVWSPDGREVWFTSGSGWGNTDTIEAATLSGKTRVVTRLPGFNVLQDFSRDGRLLLVTGTVRGELWCLPAGESAERELSWFSSPGLVELSADGKTVLVNEFGEGGGLGTAYLRRTDGSPAVRIAEGAANAISPEATWIACRRSDRILVLPAGAGEQRTLRDPRFEEYVDPVAFFPGGDRVVFGAREKGHGERLYVQDLKGGSPQVFSTEGLGGDAVVSPDGKLVAVSQPDGFWIYPADGSARRPLEGVEKNEGILCWTADSRSLFVADPGPITFRVFRVEAATGRRELWKTIGPVDPTAVYSAALALAPNGSYALTVGRYLSDLYLVEGLK